MIMKEKLVKKKSKKKNGLHLNKLFADKKKRYLYMALLILPFFIAMCVFGSIVYREAKSLMNLANGEKAEVKAENVIASMNFILRDNPTDVQKEYFAQLKEAVEGAERADDQTIAELVAKNYVTDFYTWTNKRGKYDVGGLSFIYDGEYENGDHYKDNLYFKARDGYYKYISAYGTKYGKENLPEVESVEIKNSSKSTSPYVISEHHSYKQDEEGEWYDYRVNNSYDCYLIECTWTYKENTVMNMDQFAKSINLAVIKHGDGFYIVEASESKIDVRRSEEKVTNETAENEQTTSGSESE